MPQADLADEAETRRVLISKIEREEANPTLDTIVSIAMALGVKPAELFDQTRREIRLTKRGNPSPRSG